MGADWIVQQAVDSDVFISPPPQDSWVPWVPPACNRPKCLLPPHDSEIILNFILSHTILREKNTIRDGGSTALWTAFTAFTAYTTYNAFTACTAFIAFAVVNMPTYIYCQQKRNCSTLDLPTFLPRWVLRCDSEFLAGRRHKYIPLTSLSLSWQALPRSCDHTVKTSTRELAESSSSCPDWDTHHHDHEFRTMKMEMVPESASPCPDCLEHHNKELGTIKMETAKEMVAVFLVSLSWSPSTPRWGADLRVADKRLGRSHNWVCSAVMAAHCRALCRARNARQTLKRAAEVQSWGDEGGKIRGRLNYVSLTHLGRLGCSLNRPSPLIRLSQEKTSGSAPPPPWCLHYSVFPNS